MSAVIKYLHSGLAGAPVLSGTAGAMKAVLDACLSDGWGTATVDSVTISGGIATVTRAAGQPFEPLTVALLSGATVSGSGSINGEQVVLTASGTSYTFATTATGTVSGTVQHKFAPLGFTKVSGANVGAYQITGTGGTGMWLRLDDTSTTNGRVVAYEAMSDVNNGTNPFPTNSQIAGGLYWAKSSSSGSTSRNWAVMGDDRGFWFYKQWATSSVLSVSTVGFGNFPSLKPADGYNCFLLGESGDISSTSNQAYSASYGSSSLFNGLYLARAVTGVGIAQAAARFSQPIFATSTLQSGNGYLRYPNDADGSLLMSAVQISENANLPYVWRGSLPGVYHSPQFIGGAVFGHRDLVTDVSGLSGRTLRVFADYNAYPVFIDNTGPWR
jgi:hypothetical protein